MNTAIVGPTELVWAFRPHGGNDECKNRRRFSTLTTPKQTITSYKNEKYPDTVKGLYKHTRSAAKVFDKGLVLLSQESHAWTGFKSSSTTRLTWLPRRHDVI